MQQKDWMGMCFASTKGQDFPYITNRVAIYGMFKFFMMCTLSKFLYSLIKERVIFMNWPADRFNI